MIFLFFDLLLLVLIYMFDIIDFSLLVAFCFGLYFGVECHWLGLKFGFGLCCWVVGWVFSDGGLICVVLCVDMFCLLYLLFCCVLLCLLV